MEVRTVTKYVRISPEKAGDVARLFSGRHADEALAIAELSPRKAARLFAKTLRTAVADAENNFNLARNELVVKSAEVGPGPIIKRFRPKARGSAGRILKRTSHFTVVLTDEQF